MKLIVAVDQNWAIGRGGELLKPIPADLKRFKALTMGHPILLGRKTLATFPGGRPLPGRENYILSTNSEYRVEGATVIDHANQAPKDSFVIGGGEIYRAMLDHCDTAYVTKIHAAFPADTWFPNLDELSEWRVAAEEPPIAEGGVTFHYVTYERVN